MQGARSSNEMAKYHILLAISFRIKLQNGTLVYLKSMCCIHGHDPSFHMHKGQNHRNPKPKDRMST